MMYGLIYMADYYLFKSEGALFLTDSVSFLSFCRKYLEQRDVTLALEIYYITGAFLGTCISVPAAFYYYFSGGRKYGRGEVVGFYWHGWLAASVLKIVFAPVLLVAIYLGGRLIGIGAPAIFYLVHIPGFFIIQLMILSKILGLLTAGLTDSLFPLFPYRSKCIPEHKMHICTRKDSAKSCESMKDTSIKDRKEQ